MAVDIVCPRGNEKELLEMGTRLGYKQLIFLYEKETKSNGKTALLVKNSQDLSKKLKKADFLIAEADIWAFQDKRVDIIYNLENSSRKDFLHHRNSGMNDVMAKQARDGKTMLAFNFSNFLDDNKDIILGRMSQNIRICRKYKIKTTIASFAKNPYEMRAPKDLEAVGIVAGMHPKEAKQALNWL